MLLSTKYAAVSGPGVSWPKMRNIFHLSFAMYLKALIHQRHRRRAVATVIVIVIASVPGSNRKASSVHFIVSQDSGARFGCHCPRFALYQLYLSFSLNDVTGPSDIDILSPRGMGTGNWRCGCRLPSFSSSPLRNYTRLYQCIRRVILTSSLSVQYTSNVCGQPLYTQMVPSIRL